MKIAALSVAAVALVAVPGAEAHSWLGCIDWDAATSTCKGYGRNFREQPTSTLAQDLGWDQRPGADVPAGLVCGPKQQARGTVAESYSAEYPMAKLTAGQKITMRWPAKNHATVGTQRGVQLYISRAPGAGDDFSHVVSKADWIAKYPGLDRTFSNCSPNQANVDAAECLGVFDLPTDLASGVYTFMWWWEFNGGEFYNSCADVEITAVGGDTDGGNTDGGNTDGGNTDGGSSDGGVSSGALVGIGLAAVALVGFFAYRRGQNSYAQQQLQQYPNAQQQMQQYPNAQQQMQPYPNAYPNVYEQNGQYPAQHVGRML